MHEEDALEAAIAQSLGMGGSPDSNQDYRGPGLDGAALPPEAGVSFANIAKMGFAATGPKLSPGAPEMGECMYMQVLHQAQASYCLLPFRGWYRLATVIVAYQLLWHTSTQLLPGKLKK